MAHILVVDDDPVVVASNVAALKAIGHTVAAVSTTAEASEAVRLELPDAVVMEGMLDGAFAGFDLARSLAHDFPALPLIMLTRADEHLTPRELAEQTATAGGCRSGATWKSPFRRTCSCTKSITCCPGRTEP